MNLKQSDQIGRATAQFLGEYNEISKAFEYMVKRTERRENINEATFPFHYLMVVVAEEKRVSSAPRYLSSNKILSVCNSANQLMKENPKEKIRRISFLHELNAACNLSMEDRAKNWNLFLNVHGTQIQSKEEYELWRKIIYGEQASGKAKAEVDHESESLYP